jgi:hypothetical protein
MRETNCIEGSNRKETSIDRVRRAVHGFLGVIRRASGKILREKI